MRGTYRRYAVVVVICTMAAVFVVKTVANFPAYIESIKTEIDSWPLPDDAVGMLDDTMALRFDRPTLALVERVTDSPVVQSYLVAEAERCRQYISAVNATSSAAARFNWCPCLPPDLRGRIPVDTNDSPDGWPGVLSQVGNGVLAGGEWKPPSCVSVTRLAVIIPCRDRDAHLRIMLRHLYPILQRQLSHFRIFVVEQNSPAVFNKAAMMNIGFVEATKRFPEMNCVMFHDVDHLLEDDRTLLNCGPQPHHYATAMDEWNYRLIYSAAFGGVISMQPEAFRKVNGYSLQYFGWGGEDDDMGSRIRQFYSIFRAPLEISRFSTIKHQADGSNPKNEKRHGLMSRQHAKYVNGSFDGLSDISYHLNDVQMRPLYTWIHADLNVSGLQTYPTHQLHRYAKRPGTCREIRGTSVDDGHDVSLSTCRFLCDVQPHHPCVGFSYRWTTGGGPPSGNSAGVASGGKDTAVERRRAVTSCVLLRTLCDELDVSGGMTFIKGQAL